MWNIFKCLFMYLCLHYILMYIYFKVLCSLWCFVVIHDDSCPTILSLCYWRLFSFSVCVPEPNLRLGQICWKWAATMLDICAALRVSLQFEMILYISGITFWEMKNDWKREMCGVDEVDLSVSITVKQQLCFKCL